MNSLSRQLIALVLTIKLTTRENINIKLQNIQKQGNRK